MDIDGSASKKFRSTAGFSARRKRPQPLGTGLLAEFVDFVACIRCKAGNLWLEIVELIQYNGAIQ